ncbi:MAG: BlaI/MecI/CopY family transcriptional regulator [Bacteroidia bacterium]|nr:BlaI/MecI/CopY family transcriptional regulator [Bacteroidia bacterium]
MKIKELTKAELQIMQLLWSLDNAYVNDLLEIMPEPKPAYNTVSTIVRILEKKGFVAHKSYGKTHQYYPLIDRDTYLNSMMKGILNSFFSGSVSNMVSFLSKKEGISVEEVDKMMNIINNGKISKK